MLAYKQYVFICLLFQRYQKESVRQKYGKQSSGIEEMEPLVADEGNKLCKLYVFRLACCLSVTGVVM